MQKCQKPEVEQNNAEERKLKRTMRGCDKHLETIQEWMNKSNEHPRTKTRGGWINNYHFDTYCYDHNHNSCVYFNI